MRNYSPETLHLLRRVLQYNYEILHSLAESVDSPGKRHPVFVMDLNMLLNAVERLSACLPGVPNVHHAMTALPYSRQHGEDRDIMLLLRSIAGEVETWPPQTCFSEFKMLKDIRPEHETADKANDPGRDPKDTGKYLGWVWSGANDREVTALNDWQTAAWLNKILNPSQKVPKDIDPAILEDNEVSEIWFFINGVVTDHWIAQLNAEHLADVFKRPINILHNPTDGLHRDLRECVKGRTLSELTGTSERIFGELLKHVARKKTKGKIVVVAHSQGTIITADVIRKVREEHPNLLERMEVFNFAFCADQVPDCVRHLEHYVNENHSRPN